MFKPSKFRSSSVVIEAARIDSVEALHHIAKWCGAKLEGIGKPWHQCWLAVPTLDGVARANCGDWVIKGVEGEFYTCKHDIFEATYKVDFSPFYFGCVETGHHLYLSCNSRPVYLMPSQFPSDFPCPEGTLDSGLLPPKEKQIEGLASHVYLNGWTIISFWDRSMDNRPGCNSAFVLRGTHSFDDAVQLARDAFPTIWARFDFEVRLR